MNSAIATSQARRVPWMGLLVAGCIIFAVGQIFLGILGYFSTSPDGEEFSPYSFNSREFRRNRWLGGTVVQNAGLACSTEISKHLTNSTRGVAIDRWDLVNYWKGAQGKVDAEAAILVKYLESLDHQQSPVWERWSKENSGLAKKLWPAVQQLAIHRAYFALPELFQFAATVPSSADLQSAIDRISRRAALDQAARHVAKKEYSDARIAVEWAKSFGSSPELTELEISIRAGYPLLSEPNP